MPPCITTLTELRRFPAPAEIPTWHLHIVQREMNGGTTTERDLDRIGPEVSALTISGLDQVTFERLAQRFSRQLTALHLWKCPRLNDLSPLEGLPGLTHVAVFWNQRAERLWNMRRTPRLEGLHFKDFSRLDHLDDLAGAAGSLLELEFGDATATRLAVRTLEPLSSLSRLACLAFNAKSVVDGRVQPLARLQQLRTLEMAPGLFTVEQLAWLRARLPASVQSTVLAPATPLNPPLRRGTKSLDVLVNGKGRPFLSSAADAKKLEGHVAAFQALVERYASTPDLEPPATPAGRP